MRRKPWLWLTLPFGKYGLVSALFNRKCSGIAYNEAIDTDSEHLLKYRRSMISGAKIGMPEYSYKRRMWNIIANDYGMWKMIQGFKLYNVIYAFILWFPFLMIRNILGVERYARLVDKIRPTESTHHHRRWKDHNKDLMERLIATYDKYHMVELDPEEINNTSNDVPPEGRR